VLRLGLAAGSSSGSVEVRARTGATLVASLVPARSGVWPPHAALPPGAELLVVAPGGTGRINDAAPGDALEVQLPRRGVTEICGLRRPVGIRPT
jgi:hypothetical protein